MICRSIDAEDDKVNFSFEFEMCLKNSAIGVLGEKVVFADYTFFGDDSYTRSFRLVTVKGPAGYIFFIFFVEIVECFSWVQFCFYKNGDV